MQNLTSQLLPSILAISIEAGEYLKYFYKQSVQIKLKEDSTPVTEADLFISQFVSEKLKKLTPDIPILSEENCQIPLSERQNWQEYWIIDPLDGTQQFIDRTDQFSVVIGLVWKNRPILGVIHAPILDKTYYATLGNGAFLCENEEVIALSNHKKMLQNDRLRVTIGTSNSNKIVQAVQPPYSTDFVKYGSSSLKAGLVAEGKADCYIRLGDTGEWDTAVAEILLSESGGEIFDLNFQPLSYNQRETFVNPSFVMVANKEHNWRRTFDFRHL